MAATLKRARSGAASPVSADSIRPSAPRNKWQRIIWRQDNWRTDPIYPEAVVIRLARKHAITDLDGFGRLLAFAAETYSENAKTFKARAARRDIVAELRATLNRCTKLARSLEGMKEATAASYIDAEHRRTMSAIGRIIKGKPLAADDPLFDQSMVSGAKSSGATVIDRRYILRTLAALEATLRDAIANGPKRAPGEPGGIVLQHWASLLMGYWSKSLGRKIALGHSTTREKAGRHGFGPMMGFLADCLAPLDKAAIDRLAWAIREARKPA